MRIWQKSKYFAFLISEKQREKRTDYKGILALVSVADSSYTAGN